MPENPVQTNDFGINKKDVMWFTPITALIGGALSIMVIVATIIDPPPEGGFASIVSGVSQGIFGAGAFAVTATWILLSVKDTIMSMADAIRKRTHKKAQEFRQEGREQAIQDLLSQAEAHPDPQAKRIIQEIAGQIRQKDETEHRSKSTPPVIE